MQSARNNIDRMGIAAWNEPPDVRFSAPRNIGAQQLDHDGLHLGNTATSSGLFADRGFIGMSNNPIPGPWNPDNAGSQTSVDGPGVMNHNVNDDDDDARRIGWSSRLKPVFTARPGSKCEHIERGGVCMHNVAHTR
jgi:hypothetical protein